MSHVCRVKSPPHYSFFPSAKKSFTFLNRMDKTNE
jgi:hypothetical protein